MNREQVTQYNIISSKSENMSRVPMKTLRDIFGLGTLQRGIARYDGKHLKYFPQTDGLPTNRVPGVMQDQNGIYWMSTDAGLVSYDGLLFKQYLVDPDRHMSNNITTTFIDSKGVFWGMVTNVTIDGPW